jgi:hypothetical protein
VRLPPSATPGLLWPSTTVPLAGGEAAAGAALDPIAAAAPPPDPARFRGGRPAQRGNRLSSASGPGSPSRSLRT